MFLSDVALYVLTELSLCLTTRPGTLVDCLHLLSLKWRELNGVEITRTRLGHSADWAQYLLRWWLVAPCNVLIITLYSRQDKSHFSTCWNWKIQLGKQQQHGGGRGRGAGAGPTAARANASAVSLIWHHWALQCTDCCKLLPLLRHHTKYEVEEAAARPLQESSIREVTGGTL